MNSMSSIKHANKKISVSSILGCKGTTSAKELFFLTLYEIVQYNWYNSCVRIKDCRSVFNAIY